MCFKFTFMSATRIDSQSLMSQYFSSVLVAPADFIRWAALIHMEHESGTGILTESVTEWGEKMKTWSRVRIPSINPGKTHTLSCVWRVIPISWRFTTGLIQTGSHGCQRKQLSFKLQPNRLSGRRHWDGKKKKGIGRTHEAFRQVAETSECAFGFVEMGEKTLKWTEHVLFLWWEMDAAY